MKKMILLLLVCTLHLGSFAQNDEVNYPVFDELFKNTKNYSGNVLIAVKGKTVFKKSYGFANLELGVKNTANTKFRVGSFTKQFTAMAILILQEQGKLNVNDKISTYLTDLPEAWRALTIHDLLTHTSGLKHLAEHKDYSNMMLQHNGLMRTIELYKNEDLLSEPGEKFHYSGLGYLLLASLIEETTNKSYGQFLKEAILDKVGMLQTGCDSPEKIIATRASGYETDSTGIHNATYMYMPNKTGAGNMYTTVNDLAKWDRALHNNTLISEESKKLMFTPYKKNYGYGWFTTGTRVWHGGSAPGFFAYIDRYIDKDVLLIVFSNNITQSQQMLGMNFLKLAHKEFNLSPAK